ncbi:MAG: tetratricopeptide repeat protein [Bacteroidia bacterium]|nr:tetratricopeptide repeat protein [Bacteroidia bacterium]
MKPIALILTIFFTFLLNAQNMQEGFEMLETGHFDKAEVFFNEVLKDYPDNKTAQICFARATGLNGKPEKALDLFEKLRENFPSDFEIRLNYAEALLWNKSFDKAKPYYESLLVENPNSFPAALGYANTLSNLKLYEEALKAVDNALKISPLNQNALVSKKYMLLGYSSQLLLNQDYLEAENAIDEIFKFFPDDLDARIALANVYINSEEFVKAKALYRSMEGTEAERIKSLNGLALIAHLQNKDVAALKTTKQSMSLARTSNDSVVKLQTLERHIQALIWNKKYKGARHSIDSLIVINPKDPMAIGLNAMLNTYMSDFKSGLKNYDALLEIDSSSFDGNLGKANIEKARGQIPNALESADRTLSFYPNQKDAIKFKEDLYRTYTPLSKSMATYSFDNGDNQAYAIRSEVNLPFSYTLSGDAYYGYRYTQNTKSNESAHTHAAGLGVKYEFIPKVKFNFNAGIFSSQSSSGGNTQFQTKIGLVIEAIKLQFIDLGYQREVQSFNATLIDESIIQNHFYINYNISTNFKLGWFNQFYYTSQNDGNSRNLFFSSLYYTFKSLPIIKAGVNYQNIGFKEDASALYFSPSRFNAFELFFDLLKDSNSAKPKSLTYALTAAAGFQYIEENDKQNTFRFRGELGYKFSNRSLLSCYGSYSDIASVTASGFAFTEIGVRFEWRISENPIFTKIKR